MSRRLFSPDRHYALDKPAYLQALRSTRRPGGPADVWTAPGNLDTWLLYYTAGLAAEYERMADRVGQLRRVAERVNSVPLHVTTTQEHVMSVLPAGDSSSISRRECRASVGCTSR